MAWKNVQYQNGKMRTGQGGGGASNLADLDDTDITNPQNNEILSYDSQTQKWKNKSNIKALRDLSDVYIVGSQYLQAGEVLKWDAIMQSCRNGKMGFCQ